MSPHRMHGRKCHTLGDEEGDEEGDEKGDEEGDFSAYYVTNRPMPNRNVDD